MTKRNTIEDCQKLAEKNGGKCLSIKYINNKSYLWFECLYGHRWQAKFVKIIAGHWCHECNSNKKKTIEYCQDLAKQRNGICLSVEYFNANTKYIWRCENLHEWQALYTSIARGSWCLECSGKKKKTIDECNGLAKLKNGLCLSTEYINNSTDLLWKCEKEHSWRASYNTVSNGTWCVECSGRKKHLIEDCHNLAKQKNGEFLSTEYITAHTKYTWRCDKLHEWAAEYTTVARGSWCLECSGKKKKTIEDCQKLAEEKGGKCLSIEYVNCSSDISFECKKGHIWLSSYNSIQNGSWCKKCSYLKTQTKLYDCIKKILNLKDEEIEFNYKKFKWLKSEKGFPMELDIYVPKYKFAAEYDGKQHDEKVNFGKISENDMEKNLKEQQQRDHLKNRLILENPQDIKYFIRFNYKYQITEEVVKQKLVEERVL